MKAGIDVSRGPSGRCHLSAPVSQGIVLSHSALGWALPAFQAAFGARPNGPPEPSPGLSEAMPWDYRPHAKQRPERARETSRTPQSFANIYGHRGIRSRTTFAPTPSRAPSGRNHPFAPRTQGIAALSPGLDSAGLSGRCPTPRSTENNANHSTTLSAAQRAARPQPRAERSDALGQPPQHKPAP